MQSRKQNAYETHTTGEMAEWSNAAVLKTVDCNRSGGSNPSFSAKMARGDTQAANEDGL